MELQEFVPVQYLAHLGFDSNPAPLIVDQRGAAAQLMKEELELNHLGLHPTAAELSNDDKSEQ